jgi:hypothetical protein
MEAAPEFDPATSLTILAEANAVIGIHQAEQADSTTP